MLNYVSTFSGEKQIDRYDEFGIKADVIDKTVGNVDTDDYNEVLDKDSKKAWARLLQKVYEVNPIVCLQCGSEMIIVAVIMDKESIGKIINHQIKKRAPPKEKLAS